MNAPAKTRQTALAARGLVARLAAATANVRAIPRRARSAARGKQPRNRAGSPAGEQASTEPPSVHAAANARFDTQPVEAAVSVVAAAVLYLARCVALGGVAAIAPALAVMALTGASSDSTLALGMTVGLLIGLSRIAAAKVAVNESGLYRPIAGSLAIRCQQRLMQQVEQYRSRVGSGNAHSAPPEVEAWFGP